MKRDDRDDRDHRDHRDHERIVELVCVPSVVEAGRILVELEDNGIRAMTSSDAGGQRPSLVFVGGYRVLVFENDLERATRALADLRLD